MMSVDGDKYNSLKSDLINSNFITTELLEKLRTTKERKRNLE